jgi:hypothetical protein
MKGGILAAEPRRRGKKESRLHWGLWQLKVISVIGATNGKKKPKYWWPKKATKEKLGYGYRPNQIDPMLAVTSIPS